MSATVKYIGPMKQPFAERLPTGERIRIVPGEELIVTRPEGDALVEAFPDRYELVAPRREILKPPEKPEGDKKD